MSLFALIVIGLCSSAHGLAQIEGSLVSNGVKRTFYAQGDDYVLPVPSNIQNGTLSITVPSGEKQTYAEPISGLLLTLKSENDNGVEKILTYDLERHLNATTGTLLVSCLNDDQHEEVKFDIEFITQPKNSAAKFIFAALPLTFFFL